MHAFLRMIKPDVSIALLDPSINGMPGLSNFDLTALAGNAVNCQCLQVILDGPKETSDHPGREGVGWGT